MDLVYQVWGAGSGKPPLLFAHGYAMRATGTLYADLLHRLAEQNPTFSKEDRLEDVTSSTLIVCGKSDSVIDPDRQHNVARKLPQSKEVVFAGEGHMLAIESSAVAAR